jgi:energy-coupling factor transporter ATP-binding protein EcfA2
MRPEKSIEEHAPAKSVNKPTTRPSPPTLPDPIPENGPDVMSSTSRLPEQEVDFSELADGTLVEMIEDPNNPAKSLFAIYKNGAVQIAATVECENRLLVPVPRERGIFKHVRFPRGIQPHEPPILLLAGIMTVILACVDMSRDNALLVAAFVMSTWFIERLEVAPYLALVGLPGSGKTTLLKVLNLVCRRPLLTADLTSASFYEVYEKLNPTLLVDETLTAGNRRELFHLLKTGTTRGSVTLRKGRSLKAFGPKVISCTELPNDAALNSRCVIIAMQETNRTDLVKPTVKKVLDSADDLQKQMEQYRLENYNSLRLPKVEGDEHLHSRTRDLYQALALPIGSNADLCGGLVRLFETQQEINREPLSPASAAVLRVLYEFIHLHPIDGKCAHKELTVGVNLNLELLQETFRLNAHEVGRALTSLGFTNRKRTNVGFILWLDVETRKRIHKLAHDHGIDEESMFHGVGFGNECDVCKNQEASNPVSIEMKGVSGTETKKS